MSEVLTSWQVRQTRKPAGSILVVFACPACSYAPNEIYKNAIMLVHWGRTDLNHTPGASFAQNTAMRLLACPQLCLHEEKVLATVCRHRIRPGDSYSTWDAAEAGESMPWAQHGSTRLGLCCDEEPLTNGAVLRLLIVSYLVPPCASLRLLGKDLVIPAMQTLCVCATCMTGRFTAAARQQGSAARKIRHQPRPEHASPAARTRTAARTFGTVLPTPEAQKQRGLAQNRAERSGAE